MPRTVAEHLDPAFAPKRILSLDGGGTKGIIEIAFLERIESLLASRTSNPAEFRLCHYFDLIGGTSTGAIIATALALGMTAAEVKALYFRLAQKIFRKPWFGIPGFAPRFHARGLGKVLLEVLGDRPLESEDLKTGLAIIAKRLDTGSPWVLTNNPRSKFWNDPDRDAATGKVLHIGNRHYRVREVLRASTAAPYYFSPQEDSHRRDGARGAVRRRQRVALQQSVAAALHAGGHQGLRIQLGHRQGEAPARLDWRRRSPTEARSGEGPEDGAGRAGDPCLAGHVVGHAGAGATAPAMGLGRAAGPGTSMPRSGRSRANCWATGVCCGSTATT